MISFLSFAFGYLGFRFRIILVIFLVTLFCILSMSDTEGQIILGSVLFPEIYAFALIFTDKLQFEPFYIYKNAVDIYMNAILAYSLFCLWEIVIIRIAYRIGQWTSKRTGNIHSL